MGQRAAGAPAALQSKREPASPSRIRPPPPLAPFPKNRYTAALMQPQTETAAPAALAANFRALADQWQAETGLLKIALFAKEVGGLAPSPHSAPPEHPPIPSHPHLRCRMNPRPLKSIPRNAAPTKSSRRPPNRHSRVSGNPERHCVKPDYCQPGFPNSLLRGNDHSNPPYVIPPPPLCHPAASLCHSERSRGI